jgi:conjugal transfer pilus assembly protein TraW
MKLEKIIKPASVWSIGRLNLTLSQIAEKKPQTKTPCHISKYHELSSSCVRLVSRGSTAKAALAQNSKIPTTMAKYLKRIIRNIKLAIIVFATISSPNAHAKDFGTRGHTYKIAEQGFLEMIDQRLQKVDMKKEREKMTAIASDRVENPVAAKNIRPATKVRKFHFDPTYTLDKDAVLPCGKILHKAGTTVNPLQHMDLNRRMFFVDSREKTQVAWLKEQLTNPLPDQSEPVEDRIILIGGSPSKLKEELGKAHENKVYFDQGGELTTRFGIKASPAFVVQDGLKLKIKEVLLNG